MSIHFYEFAHGKRKEPPRTALTKRFDQADVDRAREIAEKWNQFKYLKQRHLIVELRREQFTLRDSYVEKHQRHSPPEPELPMYHRAEVCHVGCQVIFAFQHCLSLLIKFFVLL